MSFFECLIMSFQKNSTFKNNQKFEILKIKNYGFIQH